MNAPHFHHRAKTRQPSAHALPREERTFARHRDEGRIHFLVALPEIFYLALSPQQFEDRLFLSVQAMPTGAHQMLFEQIASETAPIIPGFVSQI
ncbi:hypothetical protein CCGE525_15180 [Rhizobium jaguaris]|uniref:Uncharacterized protein n=1 Tax=Rhizobium jaguaris TaxID=1312183 RepID=A0A387FWT9_9HYPH|nr:hypothetical protein CCGE525_15180 [Rhizobium jaguaris]